MFLLNFVFSAYFDKYFLFFRLKTASGFLATFGVVTEAVDEPESPAGALPYVTTKLFQIEPFAGNPVALYATFAFAPVATPRKAFVPTVMGTLPKKFTLNNRVEKLNASNSIVVRDAGNVTLVKGVLRKALGPIVVRRLPSVKLVNGAESNAKAPIDVTESGITKEVILLKAKASFPIVVN